MTYQPRYVAYAKANKKTPEEMLEHDRAAFTSTMTGYIIWINKKSREFRQEHPEFCIDGSISNQDEFDKFLTN